MLNRAPLNSERPDHSGQIELAGAASINCAVDDVPLDMSRCSIDTRPPNTALLDLDLLQDTESARTTLRHAHCWFPFKFSRDHL